MTAAVVVLTVVAAVLRLARLAHGYAHPVTDYDGGVYLGSAFALVDGRLPYRDLVLVQPPGITVLFAPLALLAKVVGTAQAMGLARILTALAGAASVPLVARVVRHRGPLATLGAAAVVALQGDAVAAAYTPLLEPWLVLACLGAVALAFDADRLAGDRRLLGAGVLLGLACAIKIWAFAPALVLVLVCMGARRCRRAHLGGLALGFGLPVLPFLVAAPGALWHQVFVDQLLRSAVPRTSLAFRLVHVFAEAPPNGSPTVHGWPLLVALAALPAVALVWAWVRRPPATPLERFTLPAALLIVLTMLTPDTFYWHYAAFSTPFVVLAAALRLPARGHGRPGRARRLLAGAAAGAAVAALAAVAVTRAVAPYAPLDNHLALDAAVPRGACLVSSTISASIAADRFPGRSCPLLLDPFGEILSATGGRSPSAAALRRPELVARWLELYRAADFVYLQPRVSPLFPTDGPAQRYLDAHFRRVPLPGPGRLYERLGTARPAAQAGP